MRRFSVGVVGGRGYTGQELLRLLGSHPAVDLRFAVSRTAAGTQISAQVPGFSSPADMCFSNLAPEEVASKKVDVVFFAMPNGESAPYLQAVNAAGGDTIVIDLSSDFRFDSGWLYGLPERNRIRLNGARRITNPGCYATGAQIALDPLLDDLMAPPCVFGVSGYSGAGTTPSPRNDPEKLRDNLMPYSLVGHTHEKEIRKHLGHPVRFMPHVAPFFRGITLTLSVELRESLTADALYDRYRSRFSREALVKVTKEAPLVRDAVNNHEITIGGFESNPDNGHAVFVATLDNLMKGAATQALQNMNLALGIEELSGIKEIESKKKR